MRAGTLSACGIGLLAAACATPTAPSLGPDPTTGSWRGRFSVTLIDAGVDQAMETREERVQGRFILRRDPGSLDLELFSPFGQTIATARSDPNGAVIRTAEGQVLQASTPDELVERALGWRLPVSALPGWLSGRNLPAEGSAVRDGWRVEVDQRFDNGAPRRLSARWPQEQRIGERRLNLFVVVDGSAS